MSQVYRSDIDGLRAIAVLSVVLFHAFPRVIPGGFAGVDIFFVISGYLITQVILQKIQNESFTLTDFYHRRIKRIFPALTVVLGFTLLAGKLILAPDEMKLLGKHVLAGAVFFPNIAFLREANYFDPSTELKPLLHLWSLGVEEQFYFLWPILLLLFRSFRAQKRLLILTLVGSFLLSIYFSHAFPLAGFYLPVTRAWELGFGAAIAFLNLKKNKKMSRIFSEALFFLGLALISISFFFLNRALPYPGFYAALPVGGAFLTIFSAPTTTGGKSIFGSAILVFVGNISYPLYLWHWPLLSFARIVTGHDPNFNVRILICAISFLFAFLTYQYVEKPIRFGVYRHLPSRFLIASMIGIGILGGFFFAKTDSTSRDLSLLEGKEKSYPCPEELRDQLNLCKSSTSGAPDAIIVGDSHANHLYPGLAHQFPKWNWQLIANTSCPSTLDIEVEGNQSGCAKKMSMAANYIRAQKNVKLIVISNYADYFLENGLSQGRIGTADSPSQFKIDGFSDQTNKMKRFELGLKHFLLDIKSTGARTVFFQDVPPLSFYPASCRNDLPVRNFLRNLIDPNAQNCSMPVSALQEARMEYNKMVLRISKSIPGLTIFNPMKSLCDENECRFSQDGVILYRDGDHLSLSGSNWMAEKFGKEIALSSFFETSSKIHGSL